MKLNFITLFPNYYESLKTESITKRAIQKELLEINVIDFRNFSENKHSKVDDISYGGGQGMVLMVEPIAKALKVTQGKKILLSPQGKVFTQKKAHELSLEKEITFIAGHYEGYDERVRNLVDEEISIGDYVLTGGELPSMILADTIIRLIPGVIKTESHQNDSHQNYLLDYPQYTLPRDYEGHTVPDVLLSGHHQKIKQWRLAKQIEKTKKNRPDLYKKYLERIENEK